MNPRRMLGRADFGCIGHPLEEKRKERRGHYRQGARKPALDYFLYFLASSFLALISWNFFIKRGEAVPGGAELLESLDPQPENRQRPNKQDAITSDRTCFARSSFIM